MNKERIKLTMKEKRINEIMEKLVKGELKVKEAIKLSGLSERQIYRKKKAYKEKGIESIPHKSRGKSNGRGYTKELKDKIINIYKKEYDGWNFYHFNDMLEDYHDIKVSDSFIYCLMKDNEIESPYKYKKRNKAHPPRPRREYAGELIQVDASKHKWFFGDDNYYYLHGGIDDATGTVTSCFFEKEETIFGYQMIMKQTIQNYGIPEWLYTDYRTVFKSNKKELTLEEELAGKKINNTRFANMLKRLGTDIISTIDPRAKGRIERLWRTFQDRLYKELKKRKINTIEKANQFLSNEFIPKYNARFAFQINDNKNIFVSPDNNFDYNKELAVWSKHKVYHNSYLKYDKKYHIILKDGKKCILPTSSKVNVYTFLDGSMHIIFNEKWYDLKTISDFKKEDYIKETKKNCKKTKKQRSKKTSKKTNTPWRNGLPQMPSPKSMAYAYFHAC